MGKQNSAMRSPVDVVKATVKNTEGERSQLGGKQHVENKQSTKDVAYPLLSTAEELEVEAQNFKPLTRQEAEVMRRQIKPVSMIRVLTAQAVAGILVAVIFWVVAGQNSAGWSALYGALAVVTPAAIFARGLFRQNSAPNAGSALVGFFVWELVKIGVTVAMLLLAPRLVAHLSWLALLTGFVVTMKVYWLAMWLQAAHSKSVEKI